VSSVLPFGPFVFDRRLREAEPGEAARAAEAAQ